MTRINKKSVYVLIIAILIIALCATIILLIKDKNKLKSYTSNTTNEISSTRTSVDCLFSDYDNLDRKICGQRLESEIKSNYPEYVKDNFKKYPDLAGYYLPKNFVDNIMFLDVDKDGQDEKIVYYSPPGGNAPSRNIDIIKNDRIIFSAHGGNLNIENNNEIFPGFILSDSGLVLLKLEGYTEIKFRLNADDEYIPYEEKDTKY
jgi:hypothetical protein